MLACVLNFLFFLAVRRKMGLEERVGRLSCALVGISISYCSLFALRLQSYSK